MPEPEKDIGQRVHCRELNSGEFFTGTLLITDGEISADLFDYDQNVIPVSEFSEKEPIHFQTQNLNVVSLHTNSVYPGGTAYMAAQDVRLRTARHTRIVSHTAVIGKAPWMRTDEIRSVSFQLPEVNFILRHEDKLNLIA